MKKHIKKLTRHLNEDRTYTISYIPDGDFTRAHQISYSGRVIKTALNSLDEFKDRSFEDLEYYLSDYMEIYGTFETNKQPYMDYQFDKVVFVECAMEGCLDCKALLTKYITTWIAMNLENFEVDPETNTATYNVYDYTPDDISLEELGIGMPPSCFADAKHQTL